VAEVESMKKTKRSFINRILWRIGIASVGLCSFLAVVCGLGDYLYPDSLSCYCGTQLSSKALFDLDARESSSCVEGQVRFLGAIPIKNVKVRYYEKNSLVPGGMSFGLKVETKGLTVTSLDGFYSGGKQVFPAKDAGILQGDQIISVNGMELSDNTQLVKMVEKSNGEKLELLVERGGERLSFELRPFFCDSEKKYRAGLWVKDSAAGIGTVTYFDPVDGSFGGLGHGITDKGTGEVSEILSGKVYSVRLEGVVKGKQGDPGELRGSFVGAPVGIIEKNTASGVFGKYSRLPKTEAEAVEIGLKDEVNTGEARILCAVDGEGVKSYEVMIEKIISKDTPTKNLLIRVTDPELLSLTGGIVQGMSGSPIIQNGKLVGAVTHVLVNDPTRGYGIFIENMLDAAEMPMAKAS